MATDAERFRILSDFELSVTRYDDKVVVFWRSKAAPGQSAGYLPIAEASTLEEACDEAIRRRQEKLSRIAVEKKNG